MLIGRMVIGSYNTKSFECCIGNSEASTQQYWGFPPSSLDEVGSLMEELIGYSIMWKVSLLY